MCLRVIGGGYELMVISCYLPDSVSCFMFHASCFMLVDLYCPSGCDPPRASRRFSWVVTFLIGCVPSIDFLTSTFDLTGFSTTVVSLRAFSTSSIVNVSFFG